MHSQSDLQDHGCVRTACRDARIVGSEDSPTSSTANLSLTDRTPFDREGGSPKGLLSSDAKIHRQISLAEKLDSAYTGEAATDRQTKESNPERRLQFIIDNPTLCNLFRDHLRDNFCKENRSGWKFKTSNASSILLRAPAAQLSSGHHQNDCRAVRVTRQASRQWNSITRR
jgi:hypothetical protein